MAPQDRAQALARIAAGEMQAADEPAACIAWLVSPAGAVWSDVLVPWREPDTCERIRRLPGFPEPVAGGGIEYNEACARARPIAQRRR